MAFSRFAASTSKRASSSILKSTAPSSRLYSSSASNVAAACPACSSSTSSSLLSPTLRSLRSSRLPSSSAALLSRRNYATPSRTNSMAEVINSPERNAPSQGTKISVDEIKPFSPDPVVVSPISPEGVDDAVKAIREDIGRPIYLDVQVGHLLFSSLCGPCSRLTPGALPLRRPQHQSIPESSMLCFPT